MELRAVVGDLAPSRMGRERLPAAQAEIGAVRREADDGVARILTSAEAILASPDGGTADAHSHAIAILEACGFHDLVGQRLRKVSDILDTLESRLNRVAGCAGIVDAEEVETAAERLCREQTLSGPGLDGPSVRQSEIDALFD
jgi:chemotaxis protein CheZ